MSDDIIERIKLAREHDRIHGNRPCSLWPFQRFAMSIEELFDTIEALRRERDDAVNSMRVALEVQHIREEHKADIIFLLDIAGTDYVERSDWLKVKTMMDKYGYKS